ncbi:MAG: caspase family protein, partial [Acidobacteria bacterium]|nr:caspase family protein [Acidobacteriota bacterium]
MLGKLALAMLLSGGFLMGWGDGVRADNASDGKFALLIGIDDYKYAGKLHGAVADVTHFRDLLTSEKFNFAPENIKTIVDPEGESASHATTENIVAGFAWLAKKAKDYKAANPGKDATIFFEYSGHGSQVPVPEGVVKPDEKDGYDETIVPVDSRDPEKKHFDIIDDDIGNFISAVSASTRNAVYVFDSCHS